MTHDSNGSLQQLWKSVKTRLVARKFTQQKGVDSSKTFVSQVHSDIVRLILTQAAAHNPEMNVTTAKDLHE